MRRTQDDGAHRRAQRQGHYRGQQHGNHDRNRELTVQLPRDTPKKLTGTNTAANTMEVAIKAPDNSRIALCVASRAVTRSAMIRSTFSTTTIASSTTIPIAKINPSKVSIFNEKPKINMKPNVPIKEIGTAIVGIKAARQFCNERNTTRTTKKGPRTRSYTPRARIVRYTPSYRTGNYTQAFREVLADILHRLFHLRGDLQSVRPGNI